MSRLGVAHVVLVSLIVASSGASTQLRFRGSLVAGFGTQVPNDEPVFAKPVRALTQVAVGFGENVVQHRGFEVVNAGDKSAALQHIHEAAGWMRNRFSLISKTLRGERADMEVLAMQNPTAVDVLGGVIGVILLVALVLFALMYFQGYMLGKSIEAGIESMDMSLLGTEVEIEGTYVNPCTGRVDIKNLTVKNPEGHDFKTPHLLHADSIVLDVDMLKLATKCGKVIEIQEVEFLNVSLIVEKTMKTSNVGEILAHLEKNAGAKPAEEAKPEEPKPAEDPKPEAAAEEPKPEKEAEAAPAAPAEKGPPPPEVILHRINIKDVKAAVHFMGQEPTIVVPDVVYEDFAKEVGDSAVDDIVKILLMGLLKGAMLNVTNAITGIMPSAESLENAKESATKLAESAMASAKDLGANLFHWGDKKEPEAAATAPAESK